MKLNKLFLINKNGKKKKKLTVNSQTLQYQVLLLSQGSISLEIEHCMPYTMSELLANLGPRLMNIFKFNYIKVSNLALEKYALNQTNL